MTLRVIGNTPDRLQALRAGVVDATTLTTPVDIHAERMGLRKLAFMGDTLESINGGFGVSERWLQQRPDQIKKMITVAFRGMAYARAQRQESIGLIMSKWKLERDVAEKAFEPTVKTWSENGMASDQALQQGIEESLKVSNSKQIVPISRVADFTLAQFRLRQKDVFGIGGFEERKGRRRVERCVTAINRAPKKGVLAIPSQQCKPLIILSTPTLLREFSMRTLRSLRLNVLGISYE